MIRDLLKYNRDFVSEHKYEPYRTDKYPNKKIAIVACMDARLTELLPAALGLKNGDAKIIKNAGAVITEPFGDVVRSLLIAVYELRVEEILVIGHTNCGVKNMTLSKIEEHMLERGIKEDTLESLKKTGVDLESWFYGFSNTEHSVKDSVALLKRHPLFPPDISIHGCVMDSVTGELTLITS